MSNKKEKFEVAKVIPFILSLVVIILDQVTKCWVVKNIGNVDEIGYLDVKYSWFNDFIRIIHIRNKGSAFSMGYHWPDVIRRVIFIIVPIIVIAIVVRICIRSKDLTGLQRWCIAGVVGGGIGNIIDRIFRFKTGVVDFIDVKWFGIDKFKGVRFLEFLGWDRWPTFNVGDAAVVVCGIILIISLIITYAKQSKQEKLAKAEKQEKK